ncbi:two-component system chemotaxis response regulator CheB [Geodermatophilus normandii]|uniref:protein-glutamate methylesterase n=1 Tax=Geodermatophilus normandii TaxID=1137989 RepID=A0A317QGA7_9ACTN|nr:chemotaxis protein CheB [Geodermatophilus normandii]PWW22728.1 two-component system chemotaxis response regulator CheB [Geodermatophilus normandii]
MEPQSSALPDGFDVVVVAASAGGVRALQAVVPALPAAFPAPVLVVQHRRPATPDLLTALLRVRSRLPVRPATDGVLRPGVTVLPAQQSARLSGDGTVTLAPAAPNRSTDDLLVSAAAAFGPRVLAVVLTGRLDDGAAGVRAVRRAGGRVLVQDPEEAESPGMPSAALATGCVEHALPLSCIAPALVAYTMAPGAAELLAVPVAPWARLGAVSGASA